MPQIIKNRRMLLRDGDTLLHRWCSLNLMAPPTIEFHPDRKPNFGVCAYYRDSIIHIWPAACASIGLAGRQWSYLGYVVDRPPYGVIAHELGHHVGLDDEEMPY